MPIRLPTGANLRTILLVVLVIGLAGTGVELLLLGHFEDGWQRVPLVGLPLAVVFAVWVAARPSAGRVKVLAALGVAHLVVGVAGLILHFKGNLEFELELHPTASGFGLVWEALTGATPALAPGAIAQFGLLILVACFAHPSLRASPESSDEENMQ